MRKRKSTVPQAAAGPALQRRPACADIAQPPKLSHAERNRRRLCGSSSSRGASSVRDSAGAAAGTGTRTRLLHALSKAARFMIEHPLAGSSFTLPAAYGDRGAFSILGSQGQMMRIQDEIVSCADRNASLHAAPRLLRPRPVRWWHRQGLWGQAQAHGAHTERSCPSRLRLRAPVVARPGSAPTPKPSMSTQGPWSASR